MIRRGFTLIELLVVITILAILAGAALPYVQNYVAESRIAKAKTDLEEIARALAVYETREGDYTKETVEDLTGRYLNKAPIDPWGAQYVVATYSGIVYSKGPDRLDSTTDEKYDNISVPYQPPLALVGAKWVDKNQTGAVDDKNVADEVHLTFSRPLLNLDANMALAGVVAGVVDPAPGDAGDEIVPADVSDMLILTNIVAGVPTAQVMSNQFDIANAKILANGKVLVLPVIDLDPAPNFVAGESSIKVNETSTSFFYDMAGNKSLVDQAVVILPQ